MSNFQLNLSKPNEAVQKLSLNLDKGEKFKIRLSWDGNVDLDLHALVAKNSGSGAKIYAFDDILSTYNVKRMIRGQETGTLSLAADKTFSVHGKALIHSPDATDGHIDGDDEWIFVDPTLLTMPVAGCIEIPLIAMIHPQNSNRTFRDVQNARVIIENASGNELLNVSLSNQFGEFIGVQMGSIMIDSAASFVAVGVGFNSDFNQVLSHFS